VGCCWHAGGIHNPAEKTTYSHQSGRVAHAPWWADAVLIQAVDAIPDTLSHLMSLLHPPPPRLAAPACHLQV
jgi:hypothetical protein